MSLMQHICLAPTKLQHPVRLDHKAEVSMSQESLLSLPAFPSLAITWLLFHYSTTPFMWSSQSLKSLRILCRERKLKSTFSCNQATTSHNHESSSSKFMISFPLVPKKVPIKTLIMSYYQTEVRDGGQFII